MTFSFAYRENESINMVSAFQCSDSDGRLVCGEKATPQTTSVPHRPAALRRRGAAVSEMSVTRRRLRLSDADRRLLTAWSRAGKTAQRVVRRARIVLMFDEGWSSREIARRLGTSTRSVALWKRRFETGGSAALLCDAPGRGRKATVTAEARERLRALITTPASTGRWTIRALAAAAGISATRLQRLVELGLLEPAEPGADQFTAASAERLRRMLRLHRDLGVNLVGAAIVVDLLERLADLERQGKK